MSEYAIVNPMSTAEKRMEKVMAVIANVLLRVVAQYMKDSMMTESGLGGLGAGKAIGGYELNNPINDIYSKDSITGIGNMLGIDDPVGQAYSSASGTNVYDNKMGEYSLGGLENITDSYAPKCSSCSKGE